MLTQLIPPPEEGRELTLEVFPTDKTGIDVVVGERDRTELLKVKVEDCAVDSVQEWTAATQRMIC